MAEVTAGSDLLGMSDDDILNMSEPPEAAAAPAQEEVKEETQVETQVETPAATDTETETQTEVEDTTKVDETKTEVEGEAGKQPEAKVEDKAPEAGADTTKEPEKKPDASPSGSEQGVVAEPTAEQASSFYKQVMAPFKANGKMIQLKTPEEVIQLMQMGANYTRKLQDIQPHRKMLLMLQNNDLLDEGKLSYLIDLDKKNPEAIKKLIKDAGIDPMDIDTSVEPAYSEGNHLVSDQEAGFRQVLDEMVSNPAGQETVRVINTEWDQASKEALWGSPEIMSIIHQARESGVYDTVTTEMTRLKTLGQIPAHTPFLEAYKIAGDVLTKAGAFGSPEPEVKQPLATTVATPKAEVTNSEQANAAAPTRTTPRKAEKLVNPLAMSDEEILKLDNFTGRI